MSDAVSSAKADPSVYLPVRVAMLRGDLPISFDLYVQVNEKFILYIRKGDSFEGNRLDRIREKKLERMFIVKPDEPKFDEYMAKNLERAYSEKSGVAIENRAQIAQGHQQWAAEIVMEDLADERSYGQAKAGSEQFVKFMTTDAAATKAILSMKNPEQSLSAHGVAVATLSIAMAKKLGINDMQVLKIVTLGSLLHDLAHYKSGVPYNQSINNMAPEVRSKYKRHPMEAADRLKTYSHFDQGVVRIVLEHEELADGTGFPKKIKTKDIHPLSAIVATANAYDRLLTF